MSRPPKETLAVQLFPFLAVLVCTMGSLIFLLLVTTRQARQRSVARAAYRLAEQQLAAAQAAALITQSPDEPEPEPITPVIVIPPQPPISPPVEPKPIKLPDQSYLLALAEREREQGDLKTKWQLRVDQLASERERQRNSLTRRKTLIDKAGERTTTIKSEVDKLESKLGQVASESVATAMEAPDEKERLLLESQIAAMKKRLRDAQSAEATVENEKFQVVPFDPKTGTTRRPIFIECTAEGLRFLPEDVVITAADLEGFTSRANPLAAGTGALVNYWTAWNLRQANPRSEPEPYVLLLVRPNGIIAYYVALRMLETVRTEHGYELIEESTPLKLPDVDPGAKTACQAAVQRLLTEREYIFRTAVNSGSGGSLFGGSPRLNGTGGGRSSGPDGGGSGGGGGSSGGGSSLGSGSGAVAGGRGSGPTSENLADARRSGGNSFTMNDVTGNSSSSDPRSWERIENFEGRRGLTGGNFSGGKPAAGGYSPGPAGGGSSNSRGGTGAGTRGGNVSESDGDAGSFADTGERDPNLPVGRRPGRKPRQAPDADGYPDIPGLNRADDASEGDASGEYASGSGARSGARVSSLLSNVSQPGSSNRRQRKHSSDANDKPLEPEMLAGRRWGYCDQAASIGLEREVRVDVSEDKLVIAEKYAIPVGQGESRRETFEAFASSLDKYSHEWGRPPQGFFWTPRLKFIVKPEANSQYEQINAMMTRAGLGTVHEFAKGSETVKFGRERPASVKPAPTTASGLQPGSIR